MAHTHPVNDVDLHFTIDPVTREIKNNSEKIKLMQYDHRSERFTFDIPRYIEEHDMSLCNQVQVHYINTGSNGSKYNGVAELVDLQVKPDDDDTVSCSWLITSNVTQYVGAVAFIVRYACVTDGVLDYVWNTAIYNKIVIANGICNTEAVIEEYADILADWEARITAIEKSGVVIEPASATKLGGIKVGANLSVAEDGTLSADASEVEIDNQTIVKDSDGKLKAVPDPILEKAKATNGIGWQESSTIVYTSDMYDAAEKLYMTDEDTGEQEVFLVKISDEVVTRDELQGICSLTLTHEYEGESQSITIDRADPDYEEYFNEQYAYFGTTGVVIAGGNAFSCSQDEDISELLDEQLIIPAGTWLDAGTASAYSSVIIKHGLLGKISEEYLPSNVVFARLQDWEDDESFNTYIREPFSKGIPVIAKYYSSDHCLVLSVDDNTSSFTATKNDGLIYKYTLADGNWTTYEEVYLESSALLAYDEDINSFATSYLRVPSTYAVAQFVKSEAATQYIPKTAIDTSVTADDDDTKVPSSKAVYDYVQASIPEESIAVYDAIPSYETIKSDLEADKIPILRGGTSVSCLMYFNNFYSSDNDLYFDFITFDVPYLSNNSTPETGTLKLIVRTLGRDGTTTYNDIRLATVDDIPTLTNYIVEGSTAVPRVLAVYDFVNGRISENSIALKSSTDSSTKKFTITAEDSGTLKLSDGTNSYYYSQLEPASVTKLGGIKVGSNLSITEDGTLSAAAVTDDHINSLIDAKLGVIENGSY